MTVSTPLALGFEFCPNCYPYASRLSNAYRHTIGPLGNLKENNLMLLNRTNVEINSDRNFANIFTLKKSTLNTALLQCLDRQLLYFAANISQLYLPMRDIVILRMWNLF